MAITGATGFLGRHLSKAFIESGYRVRSLVRPNSNDIVDASVAISLEDAKRLPQAFAGVDIVVHLAGRAHIFRDEGEQGRTRFQHDNVEITEIVSRAARDSGVERFVFMSSVAAVASRSDTVVTDDTRPSPTTAYGASKLAAERVLRSVSAGSSMAYTILRPPMVFGPEMRGNPLRLFEAARRGLPLPVPRRGNQRSILYVENLAAAVVAVTRSLKAAGKTYLVGDGPPVSTAQLFELVARSLGRRPRALPVPIELLKPVATALDVVGRRIKAPSLSDALDRLGASLVLDFSRICAETEYRPVVSLQAGIKTTADWFLSTRYGVRHGGRL